MTTATDKPGIRLPKTLAALHAQGFESTLKTEIAALDPALLPLQQGLTYGSHALGEGLSVILIKVTQTEDRVHVKAGLQYHGIIAGCNCADDPSPVDRTNEYCEVLFEIHKNTAAATVSLVD